MELSGTEKLTIRVWNIWKVEIKKKKDKNGQRVYFILQKYLDRLLQKGEPGSPFSNRFRETFFDYRTVRKLWETSGYPLFLSHPYK